VQCRTDPHNDQRQQDKAGGLVVQCQGGQACDQRNADTSGQKGLAAPVEQAQ
jgi:hypothetical protein